MDHTELDAHYKLIKSAFKRHNATRAFVRVARHQRRKAKQRLDRSIIELFNARGKDAREEAASALHIAATHWDFCRKEHIRKKIDRTNARIELLRRRREFQAWMTSQQRESA